MCARTETTDSSNRNDLEGNDNIPASKGTETLEFQVQTGNDGTRLDKFLAHRCKQISRSQLQKLIDRGLVSVGAINKTASYKVKAGDVIVVIIPPPTEPSVSAENIPIDIIYEDDHIIVLNKQPGMVTHPGAGNRNQTLVNAVLHHCSQLSGIGGIKRPGVVHRLDKETSGVIIMARNDQAHLKLSEQFAQRKVKKIYHALVVGEMPSHSGIIDTPIGRHIKDRKRISTRTNKPRESITEYKVLECFDDCTLIEIALKTGRTHQVRVHLASIGNPVLGDKVYGKGASRRIKNQAVQAKVRKLEYFTLHSRSLTIDHPTSGKKMTFIAEHPEHFQAMLRFLRNLPG